MRRWRQSELALDGDLLLFFASACSQSRDLRCEVCGSRVKMTPSRNNDSPKNGIAEDASCG